MARTTRSRHSRPRVDPGGGGEGAGSVSSDATGRQRDEEPAEYRNRLRELNAALAWAEEREGRRIARLLHDEVGQTMAAARIVVCELLDSETSVERSRRLEELRELVERSIAATRSLAFELSPPILHDLGLAAAVQGLGERTQERHGIRFVFEIADGWSPPAGEDRPLPGDPGAPAQRRQAHVRAADSGDPRRNRGNLRIAVEDDGAGMDSADGGARRGLGRFHVRERLARLCGDLEIDSAPGRGTRAVLTVPLARPAERRRVPRRRSR